MRVDSREEERDMSKTREPIYSIAVWGVLGFAAVLLQAIWSLTPIALEPILNGTLTSFQIAIYLAWVGFMIYSEGYRGFQLKMAPRVAARAMYAARHPQPLWLIILAPVFCMGLIHATRKRLIVSWCVLIGIVALVIAVRTLGQPWRGIIDGGVVVGLTWGLVWTLWYFIRAVAGHPMPVPDDVPRSAAQAVG